MVSTWQKGLLLQIIEVISKPLHLFTDYFLRLAKVLLLQVIEVISKPLYFWAAAPKGSMTYAFTLMGNFLLLLLLCTPLPSASRPKSQPQGPNSSLEAPIPTLRLKSQSRGSNLSQEAQIPASKLKSQLQGPDSSLQAQIKTA